MRLPHWSLLTHAVGWRHSEIFLIFYSVLVALTNGFFVVHTICVNINSNGCNKTVIMECLHPINNSPILQYPWVRFQGIRRQV
jgi:hypothetical protein